MGKTMETNERKAAAAQQGIADILGLSQIELD